MVVKGLSSFLENNKLILSQRIDLRQTKLVINANQLALHLFKHCCELTNLAKAIDEFFQQLFKCDITPILVFDGSYNGIPDFTDANDSSSCDAQPKYQTRLDIIKAKQQLKLAKKSEDRPKEVETITRWAIIDVFSRKCDEMEIERVVVPYDASIRMARLASDYRCHVLTNDGDFFNYLPKSMSEGFILLDYFNCKDILTAWASGRKAINCRVFSHHSIGTLILHFNFDNTCLLNMLLDDEYIDTEICDKVLNTYEDDHEVSFTWRMNTKGNIDHLRIAKFLWWTQDPHQKSTARCLTEILECVKDDDKKRIEELCKVFVRSYYLDSDEDFDKQLEQIYPSSEAEPSLAEEKRAPVDFLTKQVAKRSCTAYSLALNMIFTRTCESCPPRKPEKIDHHEIDRRLPIHVKNDKYAVVLSLLRPIDDKPIGKQKPIYKKYSYLVHDRADNISVRVVALRNPWFHLFRRKPNDRLDCYTMIALDTSVKRELIYAIFDFVTYSINHKIQLISKVISGSFVEDAAFCFTLLYCASRDFVYALMLTIYYHAALSGNINEDAFSRVRGDDELLERLATYATPTIHNDENLALDTEITQSMRFLLTKYECYNLINSLLEEPMHVPKLGTFFNSTMIYRLTSAFKSGELSMEDVCANKPILINVSERVCYNPSLY